MIRVSWTTNVLTLVASYLCNYLAFESGYSEIERDACSTSGWPAGHRNCHFSLVPRLPFTLVWLSHKTMNSLTMITFFELHPHVKLSVNTSAMLLSYTMYVSHSSYISCYICVPFFPGWDVLDEIKYLLFGGKLSKVIRKVWKRFIQ